MTIHNGQHDATPRPLRVLHVIPSLVVGGAETLLVNILEADSKRNAHGVALLTGNGPLADRAATFADVEALNCAHVRHSIPPLIRFIREWKPDVIHGWMYHCNVIAAIASRICGVPYVGSIHTVELDNLEKSIKSILGVYLDAVLSRLIARAVIIPSPEGVATHKRVGFSEKKFRVILNGIDCHRFSANAKARARLRNECAIPEDAILIGSVGRADRAKNHEGFMRAAAKALKADSRLHFLLCGPGVEDYGELRSRHGLEGRLHLLPPRLDIENLYPALDIFALPSRTEASALVLSEAMASNLPAIVTDMGSCRMMVGDTGLVCPVENDAALTTAMLDMAAKTPAERRELGRKARERARNLLSIDSTWAGYQKVWQEAVHGKKAN